MKIRSLVLAGALAALVSPLAALAQTAPPPPQGPSPEMRAQFEKMRAQYQTASMNDLSADHRARVQAIIAQVQSGSLEPRDGAQQIDAILTPAESQAVIGEAQKMHQDMQKALAAQGMGPGMGGPGGPGGGPPHGMMNHKPDVGRFLLMLSMPPHSPM